MEDVLNRADRRGYFLADHELERRWTAVRERMAVQGIDFLVVQSQQRFAGGYFRWFTDIPAANFPISAVFPRDGEMTIIAHGPEAPAPPGNPPGWALRGVKERINTPAMPNVWWEDGWNAEQAAAVMMRKKPKTVGVVGLGNMSGALYANLLKELKGVNVVNASDLVDEVRMVKSEEELRLLRASAELHEMSYAVAKQALRPGRTAADAIEDIRHAQVLAGSEEQQISLTFGPWGSPPQSQHNWGNTRLRRPFQDGDVINLLVESSAAGGYFYDLRRFLCLGAPPPELRQAHAVAQEARAIMAEQLKPGVRPKAALEASDRFLKRHGFPPESRMAGHGQGLDLGERPVLRRDEPAVLESGMVVSVHPTAPAGHAAVCIADTYVITESGAVPIYRPLADDGGIARIG
ncbi:MAG: M24 family metallopeptidase [Syntrophales bacterium]